MLMRHTCPSVDVVHTTTPPLHFFCKYYTPSIKSFTASSFRKQRFTGSTHNIAPVFSTICSHSHLTLHRFPKSRVFMIFPGHADAHGALHMLSPLTADGSSTDLYGSSSAKSRPPSTLSLCSDNTFAAAFDQICSDEAVQRFLVVCDELKQCRLLQYDLWAATTRIGHTTFERRTTLSGGVVAAVSQVPGSESHELAAVRHYPVKDRVLSRLQSDFFSQKVASEMCNFKASPLASRFTTSRSTARSFIPDAPQQNKFCILAQALIENETVLRLHIQQHESQQILAVARLASECICANDNAPIFGASSLSVTLRETVWRRMIEGEYFTMLLEVVTIIESLERRTLAFRMEPNEREELEATEVKSWVNARHCDMRRSDAERDGMRRAELTERLNMKRAAQAVQFVATEMEHTEKVHRLAIVREEKAQRFGITVILIDDANSANLRAQDEMFKREILDAKTARRVIAAEAEGRTFIFCEERDTFADLRSAEVSSFLSKR